MEQTTMSSFKASINTCLSGNLTDGLATQSDPITHRGELHLDFRASLLSSNAGPFTPAGVEFVPCRRATGVLHIA